MSQKSSFLAIPEVLIRGVRPIDPSTPNQLNFETLFLTLKLSPNLTSGKGHF